MACMAFVLAACGAGRPASGTAVASSVSSQAPSPVSVSTPSPQSGPASCSIPPNRLSAGMAYMANRREAVLFGGVTHGGLQPVSDTWIWQGGCWRELHPVHSPAAYRSVSMAYDAAHGRVITYLGEGDDPGQEQATWSWDGTDWTRVADGPTTYWAGAPDAVVAYDASRGRVVLYGLVPRAVGSSVRTNCYVVATQCYPQTWIWTGTSWLAMNPRHSPPPRVYTSLAFDPTTGKVLLFGGNILQAQHGFFGDTWAWDGSDWTQLSPSQSPPPRASAALVSYAARSRLLLIGGNDEGDLADAWVWDGHAWNPMPSPGARDAEAAADLGATVILFGGTLQPVASTDVWDGQGWSST
jgi:hypothetical protein